MDWFWSNSNKPTKQINKRQSQVSDALGSKVAGQFRDYNIYHFLMVFLTNKNASSW